MTDMQLKNALLEAQEYMLNQLPKIEEHHEFSPGIQRRMKRLIRLERYAVWYRIIKAAVAVMAISIILSGMILAFNDEARAYVVKWFENHFAENGYMYQGGIESNMDISIYTLDGIISQEYQRINRQDSNDSLVEAYADENGRMTIFTVMLSSEEEVFNIVADESINCETVSVNGKQATYYSSDSTDESNAITWQGNNGELLSIRAIMDKESLIKMAEAVDKKR